MVERPSLEDYLQGVTKTLDMFVESNKCLKPTLLPEPEKPASLCCRYGDKIHNPAQTVTESIYYHGGIQETLEPTHSSVIRGRGQQAGTPSIMSGQSLTGRLAAAGATVWACVFVRLREASLSEQPSS